MQLVEKGTGARKEDIDAQEAEVRGLEGRATEASLQLSDATLRAPYDGVIAQRFVEEGQTIAASKPVVTFQNVGRIDIVVDVPEAVIATNFRPAVRGQMVAELGGAPSVRAAFPVRVNEVAQVADPVTQTFQVRFVGNTPPRVTALPGMTATVTIPDRRAGAWAGVSWFRSRPYISKTQANKWCGSLSRIRPSSVVP